MIQSISETTKNAIRQKSVYNLPDRPSEVGMSAMDIKKAFYQPVIDANDSALSEIDRVISEVNSELSTLVSNVTNLEINVAQCTSYLQSCIAKCNELAIKIENIPADISNVLTDVTLLKTKYNGLAEKINSLETICTDNSEFKSKYHRINLEYIETFWDSSSNHLPFNYISELYIFGSDIESVLLLNDDGLKFAKYGFGLFKDEDQYFVGCITKPNEKINLLFEIIGTAPIVANCVSKPKPAN